MIEENEKGHFLLISRMGKLLGIFETKSEAEKEERKLKFLKKRRRKANGKSIN
jgi:hypothetical protein